MIVTGGLIGSSLIGIFAKTGPHLLGLHVVSVLGFGFSVVLGVVAALERRPLRTALRIGLSPGYGWYCWANVRTVSEWTRIQTPVDSGSKSLHRALTATSCASCAAVIVVPSKAVRCRPSQARCRAHRQERVKTSRRWPSSTT